MAEKNIKKQSEAVGSEENKDGSRQSESFKLSGPGVTSSTTNHQTFKLSGPGVTSSTANHQTHVLLELTDTPGGPPYTVTAELNAEVSSKLPRWLRKKPRTDVVVTEKSPSQFIIHYGVASRGKHKLHIRVNGSELQGSPLDIAVYPDPSQLRPQVKVIYTIGLVWGMAANTQGDLLATTFGALTPAEGPTLQTAGTTAS